MQCHWTRKISLLMQKKIYCMIFLMKCVMKGTYTNKISQTVIFWLNISKVRSACPANKCTAPPTITAHTTAYLDIWLITRLGLFGCRNGEWTLRSEENSCTRLGCTNVDWLYDQSVGWIPPNINATSRGRNRWRERKIVKNYWKSGKNTNQQTKKNRESCGDIGSVVTVTNSQVALVNTAALWW
jgi:hypothetical protein